MTDAEMLATLTEVRTKLVQVQTAVGKRTRQPLPASVLPGKEHLYVELLNDAWDDLDDAERFARRAMGRLQRIPGEVTP